MMKLSYGGQKVLKNKSVQTSFNIFIVSFNNMQTEGVGNYAFLENFSLVFKFFSLLNTESYNF
jgi:hypothetical protein